MIVIKNDDWDYLAEGGRHILLKYRGHHRSLQYHVLRFEKITQPAITISKNLSLNSKFIETVIKPWLPQYTCYLPEKVTLQFESFYILLIKLNFHRPLFRKEEKYPLLPPLEGEIMKDLTLTVLPLFQLPTISNNSHDMEINNINEPLDHLINFEFKVKCGLKSCSPFVSKRNQCIKYNLSDFAITQLSRLGGSCAITLFDDVKEILEVNGNKIAGSSCQTENVFDNFRGMNINNLTAATFVKNESKEVIITTPTTSIVTFDAAKVSAQGGNRTEKAFEDNSRNCIGLPSCVTQSTTTTFHNSSTVIPPSSPTNSPMKQFSCYDPDDLCSRNTEKVKSAIEHLYEIPNNNFKVSVGGKSIFDCFHNDMQDVITAFNNIARLIHNDNSHLIIDKMDITNLLVAILCEENILEMLAALQALAIVDVEGSFVIFGRLCQLLGTKEDAVNALESATLQPFDPKDFKILYLLRKKLSFLMTSEYPLGNPCEPQRSNKMEGYGAPPMAIFDTSKQSAITLIDDNDIVSDIFTVKAQCRIPNSIKYNFCDGKSLLPLSSGDANYFGIHPDVESKNSKLLELIYSMSLLAYEQHLVARINEYPSTEDTLVDAIPNDTISFRIANWVSELDEMSCIMLLRMWLLGLTASDASVMICLKQIECSEIDIRSSDSDLLKAKSSSSTNHTIGTSVSKVTRCQSDATAGEVSLGNHGVKKFHFAYTISILDVGPKPVTKIFEKFEKENLKCSKAFKSAAFLYT